MVSWSMAPISCTPLLRRFPATAATSITGTTGLRICRVVQSVFVSGGHNRGVNSALKITSRDYVSKVILQGVQQGGPNLRWERAQSSVTGQGVVEGEESRGANPNPRLLILYSKPGCCLCDGLKEKLKGSEMFSDIQLEVRDITTNSEWWNSYQYEIPVLARVRADGTEEPLPRLSPRLSAEQVQKKILAQLTSAA